jgi:hypothetical protein
LALDASLRYRSPARSLSDVLANRDARTQQAQSVAQRARSADRSTVWWLGRAAIHHGHVHGSASLMRAGSPVDQVSCGSNDYDSERTDNVCLSPKFGRLRISGGSMALCAPRRSGVEPIRKNLIVLPDGAAARSSSKPGSGCGSRRAVDDVFTGCAGSSVYSAGRWY